MILGMQFLTWFQQSLLQGGSEYLSCNCKVKSPIFRFIKPYSFTAFSVTFLLKHPMDKILSWGHSNESYQTVRSYRSIRFWGFDKMIVENFFLMGLSVNTLWRKTKGAKLMQMAKWDLEVATYHRLVCLWVLHNLDASLFEII